MPRSVLTPPDGPGVYETASVVEQASRNTTYSDIDEARAAAERLAEERG